jgi:hypothetical protein
MERRPFPNILKRWNDTFSNQQAATLQQASENKGGLQEVQQLPAASTHRRPPTPKKPLYA